MPKQYFIPTADFANVIEVDAAAGEGVAPVTAGTYRAIAGVLATGEVTVAAAADSVTRSGTADSYITGPAPASGTQAITVVVDGIFPLFTTVVELFEYQSTSFKGEIDAREVSRSVRMALEDGAASGLLLVSSTGNGESAIDVAPTTRATYTYTASLDSDGAGNALAKIFVGSTEVVSAGPIAAPVATFQNRPLELFRGIYPCTLFSVNVYAGTHAQGYTANGDVSGLTLLHSVSGAAANWNTPGTGLTKAGVDPFVDTP